MKIGKYVAGLVLTGIIAGAIYMHKHLPRTLPVVTWPNDQNPERVTIYDPEDRRIAYMDKKPFSSLDSIIDWTSGERIVRKPHAKDIPRYSELEKEAKERLLIFPQ